jgi:diguanylate cyclase (GGDEF)-like protein
MRGARDADLVTRAQQGEAEAVLAETTTLLGAEPSGPGRAEPLYAQAVALRRLGRTEEAALMARTLTALCRDHGLAAAGLRARALLADLLRRCRATGPALEELAQAVAAEPGLRDVEDQQVQAALGALAEALRAAGLEQEGRRVEQRLDAVEQRLAPTHRVARAKAQALATAFTAFTALAGAGRPSVEVQVEGLREALVRLRDVAQPAAAPVSAGIGPVSAGIGEDGEVLAALLAAVGADPQEALERLRACAGVLQRPDDAAVRILWAWARVHALLRLGRAGEALAEGHRLLGGLVAGAVPRPCADPGVGELMALVGEVMRAEEAVLGTAPSATLTCLALAERDRQSVAEGLDTLFRTRVAALRSAAERRTLAGAARLDSLTGLVNRRGAAVAVAAAAGRPDAAGLALLLLDLDGFGHVNDGCGHLAGDVVLQRVASLLREHTRPEDVVARWGGDEFLVLTALDAEPAAALADRLREAVREGGDPSAGDTVTASVGVAVRTGPIVEGEWLRRAELALFTAWRSGGDATALA